MSIETHITLVGFGFGYSFRSVLVSGFRRSCLRFQTNQGSVYRWWGCAVKSILAERGRIESLTFRMAGCGELQPVRITYLKRSVVCRAFLDFPVPARIR